MTEVRLSFIIFAIITIVLVPTIWTIIYKSVNKKHHISILSIVTEVLVTVVTLALLFVLSLSISDNHVRYVKVTEITANIVSNHDGSSKTRNMGDSMLIRTVFITKISE